MLPMPLRQAMGLAVLGGLGLWAFLACSGTALQQDPPPKSGEAPPAKPSRKTADARPAPAAAEKKTDPTAVEIVAADPIPTWPSARLSGDATYDGMPAVAVAPDGATWTAWVRYANREADEVVASFQPSGGAAASPWVLTAGAGEYIRPVLAAVGGDVWCLWTAAAPDHVASIWFSRRTGDRWSPAERFLPDETRAHQNPEIAASADGIVAVVYQIHTGAGYDIHLRLWDGRAWGAPVPVSDAVSDDWDPAVALDTKGAVHVVWSGFKDGDFDIYWTRVGATSGRDRRESGSETPPTRRLSTRGDYDLHPSLAASPDGTVWAAWDVVRIPRHGRSGGTTITGANLHGNEDKTDGKHGAWSGIDARVLDGDVVRIPGKPRDELVAPKGYLIAHCAYAKAVVGPAGEPWVVYRALRRAVQSGGIGFYWEVLARPFRDGAWAAPARLADGDGYLEEAGVGSGPGGVRVAYTSEHRDAHIPQEGKKKAGKKAARGDIAAPADHSRDFDREIGWKGDVYVGTLPRGGGISAFAPTGASADKSDPDSRSGAARPAERESRPEGRSYAGSLPEAPPPADRACPPRPRGEPYAASVGGASFRLLWGDTHRHSNVSRCSQGGEPTPEDLYRYGADVDRYDFVALSDHAEDPRLATWHVIDAYWWKQQKLADLYHVPGAMSVLYNFEWSLHHPFGHHNTVFPGRPTVRLDRNLAMSATLEAGWQTLEQKGLRAITIPHTGADPGMGTTWEWHDDRYQRLCEIFQACRGSYEHSGCPREFANTQNKQGYYWNALAKGYHVGIIASSDHGYGCAYACVYAPANTREAIWQAMWDRRTYGSTTYGLVLDVRSPATDASGRSGAHWMGEQWTSKEAPALDVYVRGAAPIRSVEILGRSKVLHAEGGLKAPLDKPEVRLHWTDPDWAAQTAEQWYYVRVIQTDDEMAWSSPVWVTPGK